MVFLIIDFWLLLHMSKSENHWSSFIEENNNEVQRGEVTQSRWHRWLMWTRPWTWGYQASCPESSKPAMRLAFICTQHNALEIIHDVECIQTSCFLLLIFHCVDAPQFVSSFFHRGTSGLFRLGLLWRVHSCTGFLWT